MLSRRRVVIRSAGYAAELLQRPKSSLPSVIATTTSRPMSCRLMCASALSSPVSLWRHCWIVRDEFFEEAQVVAVQARLVVVDEDRRGDVHRVHKTQALAHLRF